MLEVKNLEIKYEDFIAVSDANFTIQKGEFFTLLGPSGCGKTTTLRAIAGFLQPSQGEINLNGKDLTRIPVEKRDVGIVFQSYALFPTMTVADNIAYGLKVAKWPKDKINERVREMAHLVDLDDNQLSRNVSALSGGQQQRVAIARALAKGTEVVLFDEPLSNLDAKLRKQLRSQIRNIQQQTGMTAIYVTHDQEEALEMSTHIAVFDKGHIEQVGTPEEIYHQPATEFVCNFIGEANQLTWPIVKAASEGTAYQFKESDNHYIRPEKLFIYTIDSGQGLPLEGKITDIVFQGSFIRYQLEIAGTTLRLLHRSSQNLPYAVGDLIHIGVNPADIMAYENNHLVRQTVNGQVNDHA